ncbi:hypothetical protein [Pseudomonas sp. o96-267]|uniref:hypothetical protein n=1 Tax=Pseudomonas sp. o96-267 TaxID=2479853 RepID=UPI00131A3C46|nr:hypothetical protein [Pseudomonas sp. o96-267]
MAALETAFALLVRRLELQGVVDRQAFIADLQQLAEQPAKEPDVLLAEQRLLRMLQAL